MVPVVFCGCGVIGSDEKRNKRKEGEKVERDDT